MTKITKLEKEKYFFPSTPFLSNCYMLGLCLSSLPRFKLRGPKHIIFYELPQYAHFYSELCNLLEDPGRISSVSTDRLTCTVLYSKYDAHKLSEVVGTERANHMLTSDRDVHMLVSGERD